MSSGNWQADKVEREFNRKYVVCPACEGSGLETTANGVQLDEPCERCYGYCEIPEDEIEDKEER